MDLSGCSNVLEKLKCSHCKSYLSVGPVTIQPNGVSFCGRCKKQSQNGIHNITYEHLAEFVTFPCRYQRKGCQETGRFQQLKNHENICEYRTHPCPLEDNCKWEGLEKDIFTHCKENHSRNIVKNPCTLQHDIKKDGSHNFLMFVYNVLFLIQTKINVSSCKILHGVKCFGDEYLASQFSFQLIIKNSLANIKNNGKIYAGSEEIDTSNSIVTNTNTLLEFFENYNGLTFIITINKIGTISEEPDSIISPLYNRFSSIIPEPIYEEIHDYNNLNQCTKCKKISSDVIFGREEELVCSLCFMKIMPCTNSSKGCSYMDVNTKVQKHLKYFCKCTIQCFSCKKQNLYSFYNHYQQHHTNITIGMKLIAIQHDQSQDCILFFNEEIFILEFKLSKKHFHFYVHSTIIYENLDSYICSIEIYNQMTGFKVKKHLDISYQSRCDWFLQIEEDNLKKLINNEKCNFKFFVVKKTL